MHGVVSAPMRSCLDIAVSPDSLDRALRIFDALLKALEAAGLTVEVTPVGEAPPAPRPTYYGSQLRGGAATGEACHPRALRRGVDRVLA